MKNMYMQELNKIKYLQKTKFYRTILLNDVNTDNENIKQNLALVYLQQFATIFCLSIGR